LLSDLHCGVTFIALYGSDMQVAVNGRYPDPSGAETGSDYACEYNSSFSFAAAYAGAMQLSAVQAPGAWIAFRVSASDIADYNNVTDYSQRFTLDDTATVGFAGVDARVYGTRAPVLAHRTKSDMFTIGPYWQRFGAWARVLQGKNGRAVLRLDSPFAASLRTAVLRVVFLAEQPNDDNIDCAITATVGGVALPPFSTGLPAGESGRRWEQWESSLTAEALSALATTPAIQLTSTCTVVLHMVEVYRGTPTQSTARALCKEARSS
jgi:hypothetical protein